MPPPRVDDEAPHTDLTNDHPRNNGTSRSSSSINDGSAPTVTEKGGYGAHGDQRRGSSVGALLSNPLAGYTHEELLADVDSFVDERGLQEHRETFRQGALVAQVQNQPGAFENISTLPEEEKEILRREVTHRWSQPFKLYFLCTLCAGSAIVQGMDQSAVNGAQYFYFREFGIEDENQYAQIQGLLNGAPYLCSAVIGCWTNPILNHFFGRRGTIFLSCGMSVITGIWMAAANNWYNLLAARLFLGFAIGAKSSTTPVYSAESTPKTIRGALTMMWQMWTAFGIALGTIVGVAFANVDMFGEYTQWRWIMASTSIPPLIVMVQVYLCPESPRWYMEKGRYADAFRSVCRLRFTNIQAARDMFYAHKLLQIEAAQMEGKKWSDFFTVRRNRRAAQSSWFVMFMQQFCGVNVLVYYSMIMFQNAGYTRDQALLATMGMGLINWIFAIPAVYTIDTFGRRNLLLATFPMMSACLFFTGFCFLIPDENEAVRMALVVTGLFVFMACYSPGAGPVPFTYSAEAFPLHFRDIGMCSATAVTWGFNFIISFTWPMMQRDFGNTGAFSWYATWNLIGWVVAYFFLPETKNLTLEELDAVFNVKNRDHARYYLEKFPWYIKKHIFRRDVTPLPPLYAVDDSIPDEKNHTAGTTTHTEGVAGGPSSSSEGKL